MRAAEHAPQNTHRRTRTAEHAPQNTHRRTRLGTGRLGLVVSTENPSDQPLGEILHLFDRSFLDDDLPTATLGTVETRDERH